MVDGILYVLRTGCAWRDLPVEFDRQAYRDRNIVERLIGWLKESRRVLTRFEKIATNFLAMVKWACVKRYLRSMAVMRFSDRA